MKALEKLGRIANGKQGPWSLQPLVPRRTMTFICFDQSLAKTGWTHMVTHDPYILETGVIRTEPQKGHEGTLRRSVEIEQAVHQILSKIWYPFVVVHEQPPVGFAMRPEASLVAATAIRIAARRNDAPVEMYSSQTAKKRLTGNHVAEKSELVEPLSELFHPANIKPWNEDVRDAVALGVVAMEQPGESYG